MGKPPRFGDVRPTPSESRSRWSGLVVAAPVGLLALFLGAITFGVVTAPLGDTPFLGWCVRIFFGGVVGSIAVGCAVLAVRSVSVGERAVSVPAPLRTLCPACGTDRSEAERCPRCGLDDPGRWRRDTGSSPELAFLLAMGVGIAGLGMMLAASPWLEGDGRWWVGLAMAALGLLLLVVGLGFVAGAGLGLRDAWRARHAWTVSWGVEGDTGARSGVAHAGVAWGRLRFAWGQTTERRRLGDLAGPAGALHDLTETQRCFARALGALQRAGLVDVLLEDRHEWRRGLPPRAPEAAVGDLDAMLAAGPRPAWSVAPGASMLVVAARVAPEVPAARALLALVVPEGRAPVLAAWQRLSSDPAALAALASVHTEARSGRVEAAIAAEIRGALPN